ncbi:protein NRT1/ PTR FAMILY 5.8-like isoform X1 [Primulina huaijiensis]|uniref:protein NRT1/ PTR FAMILY 5.8-like isoform X1 n=1 Tax=Primulina huaijiensis TaxID=1492673 RepID=UPI003CC79106
MFFLPFNFVGLLSLVLKVETVIAGMERFTFKGVASNLVSYLTDVMEMSNSSAAKYVNSWVGFTWMLPLLVATLADSYWDRYATILASSVLYAAGLVALTSRTLTWPWIHSNKPGSVSSLSLSLYMISLGQGGYNPSLQAFGAEQNEDELPCANNNDQTSDKKSLFFQWWYFGVCCGSLAGIAVMSCIQDTFGWGLGFSIPTLAMMISILLFLCGNRFYMHKHSRIMDGKFEDIIVGAKALFSKMIRYGRCLPSKEYTLVELELQDKELCNGDSDQEIQGFMEKPDENMKLIEVVKIVLRLLPVWLMLLMFAVIFQQPATFFTKQGMAMKRNIGTEFKIPPAALQSAITVAIILLMPLYDTCFIPLVRSLTGNEKGVTIFQRMGIGMLLSVVAMVVAAVTEKSRLEASKNREIKSKEVQFTIFWLLPQYILLGISDIFTVVGMQEFFYCEVPARMRTVGMALNTSVFGVGSFLSALIISVIEHLTTSGDGKNSWFSDDMDEARLDYYYWFLALSSAMSLLSFVIFCKFFR